MGVIRYGRTAQIGVYPGNQSGRFISYRSGFAKPPLGDDTTLWYDFAGDKSLAGKIGPTLSFTRSSLATYYDANGNLQTAFNGEPRFDHDPVTKESLGLLIEEARTNLFLDSSNPATQGIVTTAQQYSISVWGSGDITLSGTATGVVTEGNPLTVTATAGTLTCTVNGSLDRAQVEAGGFPTSYIETPTVLDVTATRVADLCFTTDASWYNQPAGTLYVVTTSLASQAGPGIVAIGEPGQVTERFEINQSSNERVGVISRSAVFGSGGTFQVNSSNGALPGEQISKIATAYQQDDCNAYTNGAVHPTVVPSDQTGLAGPDVTQLSVGDNYIMNGSGAFSGHIREFSYAAVRKDDQLLQDVTS